MVPTSLPGSFRMDLKLRPKPLQLIIEHASEGQQVVPLVP
jgi:hypothetical protein